MDRVKSLVAAGCLAFCCMLSACTQLGMTLVEQGRPRAQIVLPDQPEKLEQLAAEELQQFVEKMSGAKLEIRTAEKADPAQVRILLGGAAQVGHDYDGIALYRTEVDIPARFAGRQEDSDISKLVNAGAKNVIAVRVENPNGNGGLYRRAFAWSPKGQASKE